MEDEGENIQKGTEYMTDSKLNMETSSSSSSSQTESSECFSNLTRITRSTAKGGDGKPEEFVKNTYLALFSHEITDSHKRDELLTALIDGSGGYHMHDIKEIAAAGRIFRGKYPGDDGTEIQHFNHALKYLKDIQEQDGVMSDRHNVHKNPRNEATMQFHTISQLLYAFLAPWEHLFTFPGRVSICVRLIDLCSIILYSLALITLTAIP